MSLDQGTTTPTAVHTAAVGTPEPTALAPEAPVVEKPEEDPKFAARFAALSKRERQILDREKAIKAREADTEYQSYMSSKKNAKENPLAYLQTAGLSYEELTNYLISQVDSTKPLTADDKIAALEKRIEEDKQARVREAQEKEQADLQAAVDQYKTNIKDHIDSDKDKYELIHANDGHDLVFEVALAHWENTGGAKGGEVMAYDKAAEAVEAYLEQQVRDKILKTKKFAPAEPEAKKDGVPGQKLTVPSPTLTNRNTVTAPSLNSPSKFMSDEDSKRRAAALLRWR